MSATTSHGSRTSYWRGCRCADCRAVAAKYNRAHYLQNREAIAERRRSYNQDYYEQHRESIKEQVRAYRQRNPATCMRARKRHQKLNASLPAPRKGEPWTVAEDRIAERQDLMLAEAAAMLGRTIKSVSWRRSQIAKAAANGN